MSSMNRERSVTARTRFEMIQLLLDALRSSARPISRNAATASSENSPRRWHTALSASERVPRIGTPR